MYKLTLFLLSSLLWCSCGGHTEKQKEDIKLKVIPETLNILSLNRSCLFSLNEQSLKPDAQGIIAEIKLNLPSFMKGVYYRPFSAKIAAGNRMEPLWFTAVSQLDTLTRKSPREDNFKNLGAFMMLLNGEGQYFALLPLVSNRVGNTFSIRNKNVYLTMATYGTRTEHASVPILSVAQAGNPYEAARLAWEKAMDWEEINENVDWRENKTYPEAFKYLGWCSWEHYKKNITEQVIVDALTEIKESPIPFRWALVDDGYLDQKKGQLLSFGVDKQKFPNGWSPIIAQKDEKIKWMGIWRNFNGYMQGVSPDHSMQALHDDLFASENGKRLMPKITPEAAEAFYHEMTEDTRANGFDLIKVDFQSDNFRYNTGAENAILGVHYNNSALEDNCKSKNLQLLNCIAMQNFNVFNHKYSALIRGSIDYKTTKDRLDITLVQNFSNALWLGHTHWLDQDMFFANYKTTAELMAMARAVSGGPIYLSDEPENIEDTALKPLTYVDGRILGTLAPAVPLPESLMQDPYYSNEAYRVIAPLTNKTAIILTVNLTQNDKELSTFVSPKDYAFAGGMVQPYEGLWEMPKEGLLLYDYATQSAQRLKDDFRFRLESRKQRLFQLSPIHHGWSVIGRPDKYLSAAAYELVENSAKEMTIRMEEDGPMMIWTETKVPESENFEFTKLKHGLWRGELRKVNESKEYVIRAV